MSKKPFKDRAVGKILIGLAKSKLAKFLIKAPTTRALVKQWVPFVGVPLIETLKNVNHMPETVTVDGNEVPVAVGLPHKGTKQQWFTVAIVAALLTLWACGVITTEQLKEVWEMIFG